MPSQILADLVTEVTRTEGVEESAVVLINSIAGRITAAVAAAIANGATPAELAPLTDLTTAIKAENDKLAAAVAANP